MPLDVDQHPSPKRDLGVDGQQISVVAGQLERPQELVSKTRGGRMTASCSVSAIPSDLGRTRPAAGSWSFHGGAWRCNKGADLSRLDELPGATFRAIEVPFEDEEPTPPDLAGTATTAAKERAGRAPSFASKNTFHQWQTARQSGKCSSLT